ncbi:MAG: hypothetical protein ABI658_27710 [Acidimicrobiales bacterium]
MEVSQFLRAVAAAAECRALTLVMAAAWRWYRDDHPPAGLRAGRAIVGALRDGPPWPTLDIVWHRFDDVGRAV